jgi:hypothetical protein
MKRLPSVYAIGKNEANEEPESPSRHLKPKIKDAPKRAISDRMKKKSL